MNNVINNEVKSNPEDNSSGAVEPQITAEPLTSQYSSPINAGAIGTPLVVPREEVGDDVDAGQELDTSGLIRIRRPNRREWIALRPTRCLPCRLLVYKAKPDQIETEHFFIAKQLRAPIRDELREALVYPFYSFSSVGISLLVVNVTIGNTWYESMLKLLTSPPEFFESNAIRIMSDKINSRYRVRYKPVPSVVKWPEESTESLLGEAIGADHFITTPDHPIYRDLIDGREMA